MAVILHLALLSAAQYNESIRTGRPGQSIGPFVVGNHILQFQQGVDWQRSGTAGDVMHGFSSDHVIRLGLNESLELSLVLGNVLQRGRMDTLTQWEHHIRPLAAGTRIHLCDQAGIRPAMGLQTRLTLPLRSFTRFPGMLGATTVFVTHHRLPHDMGITTNIVVRWPGNTLPANGTYILNFGFPIHRQLSGFLEHYGDVQDGMLIPKLDGGLALLLHPDVQLDTYAGFTYAGHVQDFFLSLGISWRVRYA